MEISPNSNWSSLPDDLLREVFIQLNRNASDLLRCRRVCVNWESVASAVISDHTQPPILLILNREDESCSLFDINNNITDEFDFSINDRWICNSISGGWLLAVDLSSPYRVHLSNPITRSQIFLPSAATLKRSERLMKIPGFIKKGLITTSIEKDCVVLVIYDTQRKLAFCRPGDEEWRDCDLLEEVSFFDIMLYKGKFYAADKRGKIYGCDFCSGDPKIVSVVDYSPVSFRYGGKYLVESKLGDFLMICRSWNWVIDDGEEDEDDGVLTSFDVYKVDFNVKKWVKIETLGGEALFLGCNSWGYSFLEEKDEKLGRRLMNCIYYIHDRDGGGSEGGDEDGYGGIKCVSVYDMETRKSKRLCTSESWASHQFHWFNI